MRMFDCKSQRRQLRNVSGVTARKSNHVASTPRGALSDGWPSQGLPSPELPADPRTWHRASQHDLHTPPTPLGPAKQRNTEEPPPLGLCLEKGPNPGPGRQSSPSARGAPTPPCPSKASYSEKATPARQCLAFGLLGPRTQHAKEPASLSCTCRPSPAGAREGPTATAWALCSSSSSSARSGWVCRDT